MKKILWIALLLISVKGFAQITLEHTYRGQVTLTQVDAGEWNYYTTSISSVTNDTITIYSIGHVLIESFIIPRPAGKEFFGLSALSKNLFSTNGKYGIIYETEDSDNFNAPNVFNILEDDGTTLLQIDSAGYGTPVNTSVGTKLLVYIGNYSSPNYVTRVYSLPGTYAAGIPRPHGDGSDVGSAYPNPTTDVIHLPYSLNGNEQGELVVTNMNGQLLKQYKVTNTFSDILLNVSELPKGSYLYYLVTNGNHSEAKQFVVQ